MKPLLPIFFFILITITFLHKYFTSGLLPIPTDLLVGHYHPWTDNIWLGLEAGYPWKNFEINDAMVQLIPWREFSISQLKQNQLPLWNPYNFTGTPHLANLPTATCYPFNLIFFILPFFTAWTVYLGLQTLLSGTFMYWYLKNLKLSNLASIIGSLAFSFSSFIAMRWTYGITGHTWLWLPLILLSINKLVNKKKTIIKHIPNLWSLLLVLSFSMMILAGYLQGIIYAYAISSIYLAFQILEFYKWKISNQITLLTQKFLSYLLLFILPLLLTSIQLLPFMETLLYSSRAANTGKVVIGYQNFFLPWKRLITLIAPDFYGNPATHNFWGDLAYNEAAIYIGFIPLFFALYIITKQFKITRNPKYINLLHSAPVLFWSTIFFLSIIFITDNPISNIPYNLDLPFYSSLLPSRITSIFTLSLTILSAYGIDHWQSTWLIHNHNSLQNKPATSTRKSYFTSFSKLLLLFTLILILTLQISYLSPRIFVHPVADYLSSVSIKNLILPTLYLITLLAIYFLIKIIIPFLNKNIYISPHLKYPTNKNLILNSILLLLIITTAFDLIRQTLKYTPFTPTEIAYPTTKSIRYLQNLHQPTPPRIMYTHPELFPPNVNLYYRIAMIDSYDSIHDQHIETLLNALNTQSTGTHTPKRSTFSGNYKSKSMNLLSPEYIYTLGQELIEPRFKLILREGKTRLYQNTSAYPRAFLTKDIEIITEKNQILQNILEFSKLGERSAIIEQPIQLSPQKLSQDSTVHIVDYQPNQVTIQTSANTDSFLVLNDSYFPGWKAYLDSENQSIEILRTNYAFRGVKIPPGEHLITFIYQPQSFQIGKNISLITLISLLTYIGYFKFKHYLPSKT